MKGVRFPQKRVRFINRNFLLMLLVLLLAFPIGAALCWLVVGLASASPIDQGFTPLLIVIAGGLGADLVVLTIALLIKARSSSRAFRQLNTSVGKMIQGDLASPVKVNRSDGIGDLARRLDNLQSQVKAELENSALSKIRYEKALHSITAAVVVTDNESRVLAVNHPAEALLHDNEAHLLGQPWMQIFAVNGKGHPDSQSLWDLEGTELTHKSNGTVRGRFPLRTQPQVVLDIVSTQLMSDNQPIGFVHLLQDTSVAEQFTRAKDEFILNVAHELRGPLASLRVSIEMLLEEYATMSKHDLGVLLRTLQRSVVRFQGMVESLIDIGNLNTGQFRVQLTSQSFNRMVQDAIAQVEPLLQAKGQTLEIRMSSPQTCTVLADRVRVLQVIINLLINASKYGPEERSIIVSTYTESGYAFFQVTDHGPGIPSDEQVNIFQRFYRIKKLEDEGSGIGLGLALAKGIVEAHGGKIGLRSELGEETTFWFNLPESTPEIDRASR